MNIVIGGDSWGVREWGIQESTRRAKWSTSDKIHRGLWQYFEENSYTVEMCAIPGESNKIIINHLGNVLKGLSNKKINCDYIFWFQSDPIRDLRPFDDFGNSIKTYNDLLNKSKQLLNETYRILNSFGFKIYCLGGCSKLDMDLIKNYKNLIPLIPSITEFLLDDYTHPNLWHSDWINHVEKLDVDTIDLLLIDKKKQDSLSSVEKYKEFFWPDGGHPNRKGHRVLYDYIIENVINQHPSIS